jgi:WD40 repeat protein
MQNHFKNNTLELHNAFGVKVNLGYGVKVSVIGGLNSSDPPQSEAFEKVLRIVRERSRTKQHSLVSVVIEDEDFVPISFLEEGIKQSASVCRIARYFSRSEFSDFVKDLEKTIDELKLTDHNFNTADKVIEVFSIPQQIAEELFSESVRERIDAGKATPLNVLQEIAENQLGKILPIPIGSGFLVGGSHLLTNNHVIPDAETAAQCVAQFGFVGNLKGESRDSVDYEFDSTLFVSNPELDYTLVQLKSGQFTRQAGFEFGWIQLVENDENIAPELVWVEFEGGREKVQSAIKSGESAIAALQSRNYIIIDSEDSLIIWHPDADADSLQTQVYEQDEIKQLGRLMGEEVFNEPDKQVSENRAFKQERGDVVIVVQHPKGRQKQIVLNNNEVITNGLYKNFLRYKADADYGSSGSPAFNTRWELVALHHAAVPIPKKAEELPQQQQQGLNRPGIACHQGIRTCRIVTDLKQRSFTNPKLKSFIEDFVITAEQLNYPPFPSALEFDSEQSYVVLDSCIAAASYIYNAQQETGKVKLWNKDFIELRSFEEVGYPEAMCFSPDGTRLAIAINNQIRLWNIETSELVILGDYQAEVEVRNLSFSSDSQTLASSAGNTVRIWNLKTLEFKDFAAHTNLISSVSVSPDGSVVAFTDSQTLSPNSGVDASSDSVPNSTIRLWNIETGESKSLTGHTDSVFSVDFSCDGKTLASGGADGIRLWDTETGQWKKYPGRSTYVIYVKFSPDGKVLAFIDPDVMGLWYLDTGRFSEDIEHLTVTPASLNFSPNGQQIATASDHSSTDKEGMLAGGTAIIWSLDGIPNTILEREGGTFFVFNPASRSDNEMIQTQRNLNQLTVEAWVNPFTHGALVSHRESSTDAESSAFTFGLDWQGRVYFSWVSLSQNLEYLAYSKLSLKGKADLTHIAATWDGEAIKLYIHGNEDHESEYYPDQPFEDQTKGIRVGSLLSSSILIGATLTQGATQQVKVPGKTRVPTLDKLFSGIIARVRLWNIARNPDQIATTMNQQLNGDELGLVGDWRFEESQGDKIYNFVSGQEGAGILRGAKRLNASQLYFTTSPNGLRFVSATDRVLSSTNDSTLSNAVTVEAWVKHKIGNCLIVSQGNLDGCYFSVGLQDGKLQVILQSDNATEKTIVETEQRFSQSQTYHHVAFTWEKDPSEVSLYVDGRLQNSVVILGRAKTIATSSKQQTYGLFTESLKGIATELTIGGQQALQEAELRKKNKNLPYDVVISDVRVWNVCRSQDQIKANLSQRLNSNEEGLIGYWRLDEGNDDRVINLVSKAPAVVQGASWFPAPPAQPIEVAANPPES